MARTLTDFDFTTKKEGYPVRYDWANWLDGQVWELSKGTDFDISIPNFRNSVFVAANKRGVKVRTTTSKDAETVIIQAIR